jgi:hypothetical protein
MMSKLNEATENVDRPDHKSLIVGGPVGSGDTAKLLLKSVRYVKSYDELAFGGRPDNVGDPEIPSITVRAVQF